MVILAVEKTLSASLSSMPPRGTLRAKDNYCGSDVKLSFMIDRLSFLVCLAPGRRGVRCFPCQAPKIAYKREFFVPVGG
jgi:hypothetical protein